MKKKQSPKSKTVTDIDKILAIEKKLYDYTDELLEEKRKLYQTLQNESKMLTKPITIDEGNKKHKLLKKPLVSGVREIKRLENIKKMDRFKLNRYPEQTFLIEMLFSNGVCRTFVVRTNSEIFAYKGRVYYLRKEQSFHSLTHKEKKLFFHDDYFCPLERDIIRKEDPNPWMPGLEKAFFGVTPSNAKDYGTMEAVGKIIRSDNIKAKEMIFLILLIVIAVMQFVQLLGITG